MNQDTPKEPPVILVIIGCLATIAAVVWLVGYFFELGFVRTWLQTQLGGWTVPVTILLPGLVVGWILKRLLE